MDNQIFPPVLFGLGSLVSYGAVKMLKNASKCEIANTEMLGVSAGLSAGVTGLVLAKENTVKALFGAGVAGLGLYLAKKAIGK